MNAMDFIELLALSFLFVLLLTYNGHKSPILIVIIGAFVVFTLLVVLKFYVGAGLILFFGAYTIYIINKETH